jgi:hypothetical protein
MQKMSYLVFFKDLNLVTFCDEIKIENFKKSPKKHQQGGNLQDSYSHEIFIQNLKKKNYIKQIRFFFILMTFFLGGGVTKLEAFEWCFVTKL